MAYGILPDDGVMLLHTITALPGPQIVERGLPLSEELASFQEFIATEIFPGGQLPAI
jgi:cyclopropane-fatty-acyl-phospholipid synthase